MPDGGAQLTLTLSLSRFPTTSWRQESALGSPVEAAQAGILE